jgi:ferredoxin
MKVLQTESLHDLFEALAGKGYTIVGPTMGDGAVVYAELDSPGDLPVGWTDDQNGGAYRLKKRGDEARFGYVVGPESWKKFLFPPHRRMWSADRAGAGFTVEEENLPDTKYAFVGVRSCELKAIEIQDRVFLEDEHVDDVYKTLREAAFVVAVNCSQAGGTCFCVSMNTGPKAEGGYDLALTEIIEGDRHYFTAEAGSERGSEVLAGLPARDADQTEITAAKDAVARAASQMGRTMETEGVKQLLYDNYEHPRWENVANRCLTCGNCTMVCPTCFCSTVEDTTVLTGDRAERRRRWDSCFTTEFSYLHGGSVRRSAMARYRQWMTHKLATWQDQFGKMGCVGCGRCITWCPVGIDITEEVHAFRQKRED